MARPKRPVTRLRSQAVWDRLARLKRPQNWLADQMGISRSHLSMLLAPPARRLGPGVRPNAAGPGRGGF